MHVTRLLIGISITLIGGQALGQVTVPGRTMERDRPEVPVLSDVVIGEVGPQQTRPDGTFELDVPECSDETQIVAHPKSPHLCPERKECEDGENVILIEEGCFAAKTFISGDAIGVAYAGLISEILVGDIPDQVATDQFSLARDAFFDALSNNDYSEAAKISNSMASYAAEVGAFDYAQKASIASLDSAFRAAGVEPASADAPFFIFSDAESKFLPTELALDAVKALDPEIELFDVKDFPVILTTTALDMASELEEVTTGMPAMHPELVDNFGDFFRFRLSQ